MDSNSSPSHHHHPQNWLGFSLSNHFSSDPPHNSSHHSLFPAFTSSPDTGVNTVASDHHHQDAHAGATETDLSILSGAVGPRLEDFLSGGCTTITTATASITTATADVISTARPQTSLITPFSFTNANHGALAENGIYDSELKNIAAGFLRGFSITATAPIATLQQTKTLVETIGTASAKKTVDTVGIGGQEDMKLIFGITVAEEKDKAGKEGKLMRPEINEADGEEKNIDSSNEKIVAGRPFKGFDS